MQLNRRHVALGVLAWVVVFGLFVVLAGPTGFVDAATGISGPRLVAMLGLNAAGSIAMGLALYTVARSVGLDVSPVESVFLNTTVGLAGNLTPFGQASGLPAGGVLISRWTGDTFERALAALSMKELVGFSPAIVVFLCGGSYIVVYDRAVPPQIRSVIGLFTLGVAALVVLVVLVYRNPGRAQAVIERVVGRLNRGLARVPRVPVVDEAEIQRRVDSFADSVRDVTADRLTLVAGGTLTTTAVVTQGTLLWVTLGGVDITIPLAVAVFVIPVSLLASALPLPGGSGGVEGVQILLVLAITGGDETAIITAVTVSRGLVFWTPVVVGSLTLAGIGVRRRLAGE
jgi:uncharacterized protein (TIRG00374 family)